MLALAALILVRRAKTDGEMKTEVVKSIMMIGGGLVAGINIALLAPASDYEASWAHVILALLVAGWGALVEPAWREQ